LRRHYSASPRGKTAADIEALTIVSIGGVGGFQDGHFTFRFFLSDDPQFMGPCVTIAASLWVNYVIFFIVRRRWWSRG
jgi:hypothetical protein